MPLSTGDKLGPYEILSQLGAGGMGEVYRARDPRLHRDVAIKVSGEAFSERFEREAQAIAALNHPNICTLYDVGTNYLVMECIEGTPLRGPLPLDRAIKYAVQICDALAAAHKKGITHRDLKPANILVTASGVKLLDFGLAKIGTTKIPPSPDDATQHIALTVPGTVLGTAAYMSPEQTKGEQTDARSDIFSFGVVLYEMLSGRRAFAKKTAIESMAAIVRDEPAQIDVPLKLSAIITRCLRKVPAERFQTAAEVRVALEGASAAEKPEQPPSIAVLPFANLSAEKDNEYFSDGLAEEILNGLTPLPGLRVIARASAFAFRGREHAIAEIGEKLKVGSVLHGSVRRSGSRIRVTAQLISVSDQSQLWSERYDREIRDVFDIQDEIAQAIVEKLEVKLGTKTGKPLVKRYSENLEAHSLYLKGNFHLYRFTAEDMQKGRECLEKAVALEPGYAPAWVQLADYHIARSFIALASPLEEWPKALEAARNAVAADETLADAHAALGWVEALSEYRWEEALHRFETALRLNPASARTHFWRGTCLHDLGRVEEALIEAHHAVELDPLSTLFREVIATYCLWVGRHDQAVEHARHALDVHPTYGSPMAVLGEAYCRTGRYEEGIALLEKARGLMPTVFYPLGFLGWAYVRAARQPDAERFLAELEEKRRRQYVSAGMIAMTALALGDVEAAFTCAEKAIQERDPNLPWLVRAPEFQTLRSDHRYHDILRRMNLLPTSAQDLAE